MLEDKNVKNKKKTGKGGNKKKWNYLDNEILNKYLFIW